MGKQTRHNKPDKHSPNGRKPAPEIVPPPKPRKRDALIALFDSLLDSLDIGIANVNLRGDILYANSKFTDLMTQDPFRRLEGANLTRFISVSDWPTLMSAIRQGARRSADGQMKVVGIDAHHPQTIEVSFAPVSDGKLDSVRIVAKEVTEILATQSALKESEATLHSLSSRLLFVQDEERRRIARDLHDVIGQELAVTAMSLDFVARKLDSADETLTSRIADAVASVHKLDNEVRTLSYLLHPPLLDEIGLSSALVWFIEGFTKRTGIKVHADLPREIPRLRKDKETALFRVAQECLTNVFRHSESKQAWVRVAVDDSFLEVCVRDEGKGFGDAKAGVGIQSMTGRLSAFGGTLAIHSHSRHTEVIARMPRNIADQVASIEEFSTSGSLQKPRSEPHEKTQRNRVLIADDHEVARQGLRFLLQDQPDLEVCGEATNGLEAVQKADLLRPDLIILDVTMPQMSGFSAATQIRRASIPAKILIFTTHSYPYLERVARASGCNGFVMKSNATKDLLQAARIVLKGGEFYGSEAVAAGKANSAGA